MTHERYSIIVVPTGIVVTVGSHHRGMQGLVACPGCGFSSHPKDAVFCHR